MAFRVLPGGAIETDSLAEALEVQKAATSPKLAGKRPGRPKGTSRPGVKESWDRARQEAARTGESPAVVRKRQAADAKKLAANMDKVTARIRKRKTTKKAVKKKGQS